MKKKGYLITILEDFNEVIYRSYENTKREALSSVSKFLKNKLGDQKEIMVRIEIYEEEQ